MADTNIGKDQKFKPIVLGVFLLIIALLYTDISAKLFTQNIIKTFFPVLFTFVLVLLAIPPVIWVISVSFLGKAIRIAKEIKATKENQRQTEEREKLKEAEQKCKAEQPYDAEKCLRDIREKREKLDGEIKNVVQKYGILSIKGSVVTPSILFVLTLLLIGSYSLYQNYPVISLLSFIITVVLIALGVTQIYKVMKVIEEVAQPADEAFMKTTIDAFRQVLIELEESKKPQLAVVLRNQLPINIPVASQYTFNFFVHLTKAEVARNSVFTFFAPQGFDYPEIPKTQQVQQLPNFIVPNATGCTLQLGNTLFTANDYTVNVKIKASNIKGSYTFAYCVQCENFKMDIKTLTLTVV